MKKLSIVAAAMASSAGVYAQSAITVFGAIDALIAVGHGSITNRTQLSNSGLTSSAIGFRGTEDLGAGTRAGYWLEAGINNDNGSGQTTKRDHPRATKFAAGYSQSLSKRTTLYATIAHVRNTGASNQALNGASTATGQSSTGLDLGIAHKF